MKSPLLRSGIYFLLSLGGLLFIHYGFVRPDWNCQFGYLGFLPFLLTYALLSGLYVFALQSDRDLEQVQWKLRLGMVLRLAILFCLPNLSDDFYRFYWDGMLWWEGQDPLELTPTEWLESINVLAGDSSNPFGEIYPQLNSKEYYTIYPPALQFVFAAAVGIGGKSLLTSVIVMKSFILLAEWGSIRILQQLLKIWKKPAHWVLIYALNPLVISELTGNLHFEAFMVFFVLGGIWLLQKGYWTWAGLSLGWGISSKLLPLMVFPYLIRRLGFFKAVLSGMLAVGLSVLLFWACFSLEYFPNFLESVRLYFQSFEFNANIYYIGRWVLGEEGYWINRILPFVVMAVILWWALRNPDKAWKSLPLQLLAAFSLYQLTQPVIHPWYLAPLVAFAALTSYRFPLVWAMLIPFTYLTYASETYDEPLWVLWIEYTILFGFILYEWLFDGGKVSLEEFVHGKPALRNWLKRSIPARMAIKLDRIASRIPENHQVLDLGTGNGGLCHELRKKGYAVTPVDVKDISLFEDVRPNIYDGEKLPYENGSVDTVMLITVLHHTPDPESILDEAIRVSGSRVLVMEDVYSNPIQKYLTYFTDSLVNLEFAGHPHTNKTDQGWQETFKAKGLKLVDRESFRTLIFFRQVIYVLEKEG